MNLQKQYDEINVSDRYVWTMLVSLAILTFIGWVNLQSVPDRPVDIKIGKWQVE